MNIFIMGWSLRRAFRHPGKALGFGTKKFIKLLGKMGVSVSIGASGGRVGACAKVGKVPVVSKNIVAPAKPQSNKVPAKPIPKHQGCYGVNQKTTGLPTITTNETVATLNQKLKSLMGKHVGESTECVALVKALFKNLGAASSWSQGTKVKGNANIKPGTPIATFGANGKYLNKAGGSSHAAIFVRFVPTGIEVIDQANGYAVRRRVIQYRNGAAKPANDGDKYYTITK
jgi:hypothetical protein